MKTPKEIIDAIGIENAMNDLDVSKDRVKRASRSDQLPASWFDYCERQLSVDLDRDLFSFK